MATLTMTHSVLEGTLLAGTSRGDAGGAVLKAIGWRWARSLGCWYLPHTRDHHAPHHRIATTRDALTAAGFAVEISIDDQMPTSALEAAKLARQDDRVTALTRKAAQAGRAAAAATSAAQQALDQVPPGGEPIKIGHHSEGRHRRAIDRAHAAVGMAVQAEEAARRADAQLRAAQATTSGRYSPATVANRIAKLEAEIRSTRRILGGYTRDAGPASEATAAEQAHREHLEARLAEQLDARTYWQQVRAAQIASGAATNYQSADVHVGDLVQYSGTWWKIVRVNPTSVTVNAGEWTNTIRYPLLTGHRALNSPSASSEL